MAASEKQSVSKQAYRDYITVTNMLIQDFTAQGRETDADGRLQLYDEFLVRIKQEAETAYNRIDNSRSRDKPLWYDLVDTREIYADERLQKIYVEIEEEDEEDEDDRLAREAEEFGTDVDTWLEFLEYGLEWYIGTELRSTERYRPYAYLEDLIQDIVNYASAVEYVRFDGEFYWIAVADSSRRAPRSRRKSIT